MKHYTSAKGTGTIQRKARTTRPTVNRAGGPAHTLTTRSALAAHVLNGFYAEPNYYGDTLPDAEQVVIDCASVDPEFVLKAAAYARNVGNMRSMPVFLLAQAAFLPNTKQFVRRYTPYIVRRADQLVETISMWRHYFAAEKKGRNRIQLPNALRRGLADTWENFNEYQLAKYDRDTTPVNLSGAMQLTHPRPATPERADLYKRLLERRLATPATWETHISRFGSSKAAWEEIFPQMGYMAVLRNLRNFIQNGVNLKPVIAKLQDPEQVRRSKQLPFRFWSAYNEVVDQGAPPALLSALDSALRTSLENLPQLDGPSAAFADTSGSMASPVSGKSKVTCSDIACLMTAMFNALNPEAMVGAVGTSAKASKFHSQNSIIDTAERVKRMDVGWSTNYHTAINLLTEKRKRVNRILIFGDMQTYNTSYWSSPGNFAAAFAKYRANVNPEAHLYMFNLHTYGTTPMSEKDTGVTHIAGWNQNVFKFMEAAERGVEGLVQDIQQWDPCG